jgi:O-antigen/teichoic acid export membrane protein
MATALDAQGRIEALQKIYLAGSRLLLLAAVAIGLIAGYWANDFYQLWLPDSSDHALASEAATLFFFLLIGAICTAGQRVGYQILLGSRRLKLLALLLGSEALVSLALTLCLIQRYGLVGVAVANLLPAVVFQALIHPLTLTRILEISWLHFMRVVWLPFLLLTATLAGILTMLRSLAPTARSWGSLSGQVSLAVGIAALLLIFTGLDSEHREALISELRRSFSRWRGEPSSPLSRSPVGHGTQAGGILDPSIAEI